MEADGQPMWMDARLNDVGPAGFGPVGDLDGDGKTEVAVATVDGRVHCLRGADGSRKWEAAVPAAGDAAMLPIRSRG